MAEQLERGAEILKLARLLDVEPKDLAYLEQIPAAALRAFREQATDRLFAGDADRLRRVAAASKLVPVPVTVKLAQIALGPVLCAATAGLLDPRHAVRIASKCPTTFLADITVHLDPRRAPEVIAAVPTPLVVAVARELLARGEYVTMGRFVSYLTPETLRASVHAIPDDADLLKVAFVMEGKEKLDEVAGIARDRFAGLIRTAFERDLWSEALDLVGHLGLRRRAELGDAAAAQDDELLDALVRAGHRLSAWDTLLPVTAAMSEDSLRRFAQVPALHEPDVLGGIVDTALSGALWRELLPLTRYLPDDARTVVAEQVAGKDDATIERLVTEAEEAHVWDTVLAIVGELRGQLSATTRRLLRERAAAAGRDDVADALR